MEFSRDVECPAHRCARARVRVRRALSIHWRAHQSVYSAVGDPPSCGRYCPAIGGEDAPERKRRAGEFRFAFGQNRRGFLKSLSRTAIGLSLQDVLGLARPGFAFGAQQAQAPEKPKGSARQSYEAEARPAPKGAFSPVTGTPLGVQFVDVAKEAGLNVETIFGGEHRNKYLLETTGCGCAFFDYDQDDWLDIFLVNGWRLEGFPKGHEPVCHLFKNNRDGTFTDVTIEGGAGAARDGARRAAWATTTTTDGTICSSATTGRTRCIATTGTARLPM